jgi:crossover junction endodeoxyribonuclease RuvC
LSHMRLLGVDPGAGGALALVAGPGKLLVVKDMPTVVTDQGKRRIDAPALSRLVQDMGAIDGAVIELVGPMPRDGRAGAFWFGKAAGVIEGVLAGMNVPFKLVPPQTWKRRLDVSRDKNAARARASQLFPGSAGEWKRVKDDGRAEAAMIGLWGWMDDVAGTW